MNKKIIISIIILIFIIVGFYFWTQSDQDKVENPSTESLPKSYAENQQTSTTNEIQGMKIETLKEGTGEVAKVGDTVTVNYVGTLLNGTKFDSSIDRNTPFSFTIGQNRVIQGWELGVQGMKIGEKRKLTIPPELAYGNQAVGGVIPANSTLVFEIDLLGIN